jgi:hypothetical protein
MIDDICREYDLASREHLSPPEAHNFYGLIAASDEKVHDGTDVSVL